MPHEQSTPTPNTTPPLLLPVDAHIPKEVLNLIPDFNGETKILNLFLRKCKYVITRYQGTVSRNEFLMQCITSKLTGKAAALISERGDFTTYGELESLLVQHFGDPRSEECVALELETLKIRTNESYLEFCGRIQDVRAILISKVNQNSSPTLREAKQIIYNNTSLNVFLYNLSEHMVRLVRLKEPNSLEDALKHVLEEINFQEQYNMRTKMLQNKPLQFNFKQQPPLIQGQYKFGIPNQIVPQSNFQNFAQRAPVPQQFGYRPPFNHGAPAQQFGQRPPFGVRPQQVSQFGFRPQIGQFGYRPQLQPAQAGFKPQQGQFGYRPPQFGFRPQAGQFGYRAPQPQGFRPNPHYSNDVTMRTAPAHAPKLNANEMYTMNEGEYTTENAYDYEDVSYSTYEEPQPYDVPQYYDATTYQEMEGNQENYSETFENATEPTGAENFRLNVSSTAPR